MRRVSNIERLNSDWSNSTRVVLSLIVNKSEKQNTTNKASTLLNGFRSTEFRMRHAETRYRQTTDKQRAKPHGYHFERNASVESTLRFIVHRTFGDDGGGGGGGNSLDVQMDRYIDSGTVQRCRCADCRQHQTMHTFIRLASLRRHCPCVRPSHTDVFVVRVR